MRITHRQSHCPYKGDAAIGQAAPLFPRAPKILFTHAQHPRNTSHAKEKNITRYLTPISRGNTTSHSMPPTIDTVPPVVLYHPVRLPRTDNSQIIERKTHKNKTGTFAYPPRSLEPLFHPLLPASLPPSRRVGVLASVAYHDVRRPRNS